jgi:hypothetical protein
MTSRAVPFILLVATIGLWSAVGATARAEECNPAALKAAKVLDCPADSRRRMTMSLRVRRLALVALLAAAPGIAAAADDWQAQVGETLGKTGSATPSGIYRVGLPRTDLIVTLDGFRLRPGFALGGWLGFQKTGDQAMVMGDLVLAMDEVSPVMK